MFARKKCLILEEKFFVLTLEHLEVAYAAKVKQKDQNRRLKQKRETAKKGERS